MSARLATLACERSSSSIKPRVGDRDGRLVGQPAEDRGVDVVEGVTVAPVDLDGAERSLVSDDRGDDEVADPRLRGHLVGLRNVLELTGEVVAGGDDASLEHRPAGQPLAEAEAGRAHRLALLIAQPRVVGGDQDALGGVELVDHRAVGTQQTTRLVDDPLKEVAGLADGCDPGRDLAQRLFRLGAAFDDRAGAGQFLDQARVPDGDRGLRRERGQHVHVGIVIGTRLARDDRQRPERRAVAGQRDGDDRSDPGFLDEGPGLVVADEAVIGQVVVGAGRALLGEGGPGDGLAGLEAAGRGPLGHHRHRVAGRVRPAQRVDLRVVQVDPRAVRFEQPDGLVDDLLEDLVGLEDGRDAGGDLAQGLFRIGTTGELGARARQRLDEPRVGDRDGGLAGKGEDKPRVGLAESTAFLGVDLDDAERAGVAGDRDRDHRLEPGPLVELGRFGGRREERREVAVGDDDPVLRDGCPGRADTDRDPELRPLLGAEHARQPVVVGPVEVAGRRVEEVEDHAVGTDQAPGLGHDILEDLRRLAQDRDPGSDLAQRLLRLRPPGERLARLVELVDQAGRADGDRGLVGDGLEQRAVLLAPLIDATAEDGQCPDRDALDAQRRGHDRMEPGPIDVLVRPRGVREARVADVVAGPERPAGDDRLAGDALVERLVGVVGPILFAGLDRPGRVCPAQQTEVRVDQVDPRAVGAEQAGRLVDAELEDCRQVGRGTDPGGDLAQRALDVGPLGEFAA